MHSFDLKYIFHLKNGVDTFANPFFNQIELDQFTIRIIHVMSYRAVSLWKVGLKVWCNCLAPLFFVKFFKSIESRSAVWNCLEVESAMIDVAHNLCASSFIIWKLQTCSNFVNLFESDCCNRKFLIDFPIFFHPKT